VGLPTCYPEVDDGDGACAWRDGFDLVLAHALAREGHTAVASDFAADPSERAFVITGPNHGGKTTFARALGQLHVLAALGCPVPGSEARVGTIGPVFTHFERAERAGEDARSRLEDELVRIREIFARATPATLIVINEMLAGTTLGDAVRLGRRVMEGLAASGARYLWVTFIEDLAGAPGAVSLAAVSADDLTPTFRVERRPPDGVAHALALARRHGLDPASLREVLEA
jgi:DNA mismatch repair ATPase MutS